MKIWRSGERVGAGEAVTTPADLLAAGWRPIEGADAWSHPDDAGVWVERIRRRGERWVLWLPGRLGRTLPLAVATAVAARYVDSHE